MKWIVVIDPASFWGCRIYRYSLIRKLLLRIRRRSFLVVEAPTPRGAWRAFTDVLILSRLLKEGEDES